jgi:hypothetical protein
VTKRFELEKVRDEESHTEFDRVFISYLQRWLRTHGVDGYAYAMIVIPNDEGFHLLQVGPQLVPEALALEWLALVGAMAANS